MAEVCKVRSLTGNQVSLMARQVRFLSLPQRSNERDSVQRYTTGLPSRHCRFESDIPYQTSGEAGSIPVVGCAPHACSRGRRGPMEAAGVAARSMQ